MLQIIFASFSLASLILALIFIGLRYFIYRFMFLLSSAFFLAYCITNVFLINYGFISLIEISYILLAIFALILFVHLLIGYIRNR